MVMIKKGDLVALLCKGEKLDISWERQGICVGIDHPTGWVWVHHEDEKPTLWPRELIVLVQACDEG